MSALDCERRTIWIVDALRDNGKRFVARADERLTASPELESATAAAEHSAQISAPTSSKKIELSETRFHADVNRLIEAIEKSFAVAEKKRS